MNRRYRQLSTNMLTPHKPVLGHQSESGKYYQYCPRDTSPSDPISTPSTFSYPVETGQVSHCRCQEVSLVWTSTQSIGTWDSSFYYSGKNLEALNTETYSVTQNNVSGSMFFRTGHTATDTDRVRQDEAILSGLVLVLVRTNCLGEISLSTIL